MLEPKIKIVPMRPETPKPKVITVRMPLALHEKLINEAHEHRTSLNQLCLTKLNLVLDHKDKENPVVTGWHLTTPQQQQSD